MTSVIKSFRYDIFSVILLWVSSYGASIAAFALSIMLARFLPTSELGFYFSSLALLNLLTQFSIFGLPGYFLKVFGEEGYRAFKYLRPSISIFAFGSLLSILIYFIYLFLLNGPYQISYIALGVLMLPYFINQIILEISTCKLQLEENFLKIAFVQMLPHISRLLFISIVFFIFDSISLLGVCIGIAAAGIFSSIVSLNDSLSLLRGNVNLKGHRNTTYQQEIESPIPILSLLKNSTNFFLIAVLFIIYFQINIIFVNFFASPSQAGVYGIAFTFMLMVYLAPNILYQRFLLPRYHRWMHNDFKKMKDIHINGFLIMLIIGISVSAFLFFLSEPILFFLYGEISKELYSLISIMLLAVPFRYIATNSGAILNTKDFVPKKIKIMIFASFIALLSGIPLIIEFGALGAVYSSLLVDFYLAISYFIASHNIFKNTKMPI